MASPRQKREMAAADSRRTAQDSFAVEVRDAEALRVGRERVKAAVQALLESTAEKDAREAWREYDSARASELVLREAAATSHAAAHLWRQRLGLRPAPTLLGAPAGIQYLKPG